MSPSSRPVPGCRLLPLPDSGTAPRARAVPSFLSHDPHPPRRIGYVLQRGCRAPARRVLGRRVRYVIGGEPGQVNGMRWRRG